MKLGIKGRRAAIEILIECLQAELAAMPPDDTDTAPSTASTASQPAPSAPPFMGRPMTSKFGGRCAVCSGSIQQGVPVIYNGASKKTAHAGCGVDDGGHR